MIKCLQSFQLKCNCYLVLASDIESSWNSVCLGLVYGVIGKIQILAGI